MNKFFTIFMSLVLLVVCLAVGASAAEYVYYENDFSDPATLADFTQYRGEWDIVDGKLMLVGIGDLSLDTQVWMLYTADDGIMNLTDYILDVDMYCLSTQAGPIFRCDLNKIMPDQQNGFFGYQGFVSFAATQGVIGHGSVSGGWAGNLVNSEEIMQRGDNIHMQLIAEGTTLTNIITDLETGEELWRGEAEDPDFAYGTFGFKMVVMKDGVANLGVVAYDNIKITAINEVGDHLAAGKPLSSYKPTVVSDIDKFEITKAVEVVVPEVVQVSASDLDMNKTEYVFYENDFSDPATLADFTQYRGKWAIKDGKLYYNDLSYGFDSTGNFSFILYSANHDADLLRNYTFEVDVYNTQSAAGPITRADLSYASSAGNDAFRGYLTYVSSKGDQIAIGRAKEDGGWGGLVGSSETGILAPGSNYHIKVEHLDATMTASFYNIGEEEPFYVITKDTTHWTEGTFGLRSINAKDLLVNLGNTGYDNFKVTVYGEEAVLLNAGYHPNAEIVEGEVPANTDAPEATDAPVVATDAPAVATDAPEVTTAPVETAEVPATTDVDASAAPETTVAPDADEPVETTAAADDGEPVETTAAPAKTDAPAATDEPAEGGAPVGLIIGIVAAVVVIATVVVVVFKKKK